MKIKILLFCFSLIVAANSIVPEPTSTLMVDTSMGYPTSFFAIEDINKDNSKDLGIAFAKKESGYLFIFQSSKTNLLDSQFLSYNGPHSGSIYGYSLAYIGDPDNNGMPNFVVTVPGYSPMPGYPASPYNNLGALYQLDPGTIDSYLITRNYAQFVTAADINNDSIYDLIVSCQRWATSTSNNVRVYYGNSLGNFTDSIPNTCPEWNKYYDSFTYGRAAFPFSLSDLNDDGTNDIAICSRDKIEIFSGSKNGLDSLPFWVWQIPDTIKNPSYANTADWHGSGISSYYSSISNPVDFNKDGFKDIVITLLPDSNLYGNARSVFKGRCYIFYGSKEGLSTTPKMTISNLYGDIAIGFFNSDTFPDIAAPKWPQNALGLSGCVQLFYGGVGNFEQNANTVISTIDPTKYFGSILKGIDLDGDGYDELIAFCGVIKSAKNAVQYYKGGKLFDTLPKVSLPGWIFPVNNSQEFSTDSAILSWHPGSSDVDFYTLKISNSSEVTYIDSVTDTIYKLKGFIPGSYTWTIRAHNETGYGGYNDGCHTFKILASSLVRSYSNKNQAYVQLFNNKIRILASNESIFSFRIFNLAGQLVLNKENVRTADFYDLSNLGQGSYITQIYFKKKSFNYRFLKN